MVSPLRQILAPVRRRPALAAGTLASLLVGLGAAAFLWPAHLFRSGEQALARRDFGLAQQQFERYLWYRRGSVPAHLLAARAARRRDAFADAERHLAACRELDGASRECALEGCLLRAQQGDVAKVEPTLQSSLRENSDQAPLVLEALARGYLAASRPGDALDAAEALLQREPDHPAAHRCYALAAMELNHGAEALPHFLRAVELDPGDDELRSHLADCLAFQGHSREAVAHYEYLLRRRLGDPAALYGLARCKYDAHRPEEARDLLDTLLARDPGHAPALVERGRVAFQLEGPAAGEVWLRRALDRAPGDSTARRLLLAYLRAQGKDAGADRGTP